MRLTPRTIGILAFGAALAVAVPAFAQSDTRGLVDRMDRLERDVNTLQSQVYRAGGTSVINSPAIGGGTTNSHPSNTAIAGDAYSTLDQRISSLEQQIRDLTGQIEKAGFTASQVSAKLDRMQADTDLRLKELEQKNGGGAPVGGASAPASQPGNTQPTAGGDAPASQSGNLKHPAIGQSAAAAPAGNAPALVGKTPQEQYDYAFNLLRNSDNDGAAKAFQAFVAQHPQDPLAGNAMYWQGQIPYSQGQWEQAAPLFLSAYSKYPKSAKAGESLLKLGLSLSNLNKKKEACSALGRFTNEYPDAADNLRRTATSEKKKLGC